MNTFRIATIALVSVGALWATPISYGTAGYDVTVKGINKKGSVSQMTPEGALAFNNPAGYGLTLYWDVDGLLSWNFVTTVSGLHTLRFYMGIPMDSYYQIFTSVGYSITGRKNGKGATVSDITLKPYGPLPIGSLKNYIPQGFTTVKGAKTVKGTVAKANDNSNAGGAGDFVNIPVINVKNLGVELTFTTTQASGDRFAMNGIMALNRVPEPATLAPIGAALIALLVLVRRQYC